MTAPRTLESELLGERLRLARAHRDQGTAATEDALQDALRVPRGYALPTDRVTRSLARALGAWLDEVEAVEARLCDRPRKGGARPGAGRPRTRPEGARKVQVVLSPAAAQEWAEHEGNRSALVSLLLAEHRRQRVAVTGSARP